MTVVTPSPSAAGRSDSEPDTARAASVTMTGCLQAEPKGKGFVLTDVRPSKAGTSSPLTSAAAGTSATGDAPSGSVTGKTPTGSTATTTSVETPAAGTAGATANPASPTFNQGDDATAGTAGTVPRPDDARATPVQKYQLTADAGVNLSSHVGHTVEIRGMLKPSAGTPPAEPAPREGRGSSTAEPTGEMRAPVIEVAAVTHVAAGCQK